MSFWKIIALAFWLFSVLAIASAAHATSWDGLVLHALAASGFSGVAGWAERMVAHCDRVIKIEETFC